MTTAELKVWLHKAPTLNGAGRHTRALVGMSPNELPASARRSLQFVLSVLHDMYADDFEVWLWFVRPRNTLKGIRPIELLVSGRVAELERFVVRQWNQQATRHESGLAELEEAVVSQWEAR